VEIARLVESSDPDSLLSTAQVDLARGTATDNGKYTVWSVPTVKGGICVLVPNIGGSFAAGCDSIDDFNAGGNVGVGLVAPDTLVAAVAQPPGVQSDVTDNDSSKVVDTASGVAAVVLKRGETLRSGSSTFSADDLLAQSESSRAAVAKQATSEE